MFRRLFEERIRFLSEASGENKHFEVFLFFLVDESLEVLASPIELLGDAFKDLLFGFELFLSFFSCNNENSENVNQF